MRTTFITVLTEQARKDDKIFILTPDMGFSVFEKFAEQFPDRFMNTGIAEQNTISVAAGLALSGFKPYVYSIAPFVLFRCFEQVRLDAAYMQTNIKIVGVGGGVAYGAAGTTHHIIEDFAVARSLPGMTVCAPADPIEAKQIFEQSFDYPLPMYIRLAKNNDPVIHNKNDKIKTGKAFNLIKGNEIEIITTGIIANRMKIWQEGFEKQGFSTGLTIFHTIKPLDTEYLDALIETNKKLLIVEEHSVTGGLGEAICAYFCKKNAPNQVKQLGIPDVYSHFVGSQSYILKQFGLWDIPIIKNFYWD